MAQDDDGEQVKAPSYWPEWAVDYVRREAVEFHRSMLGDWPVYDVELERSVRHVVAQFEKAYDADKPAPKGFWSRYEDGRIDDDVQKLLVEYRKKLGAALR